MKQTLFSKMCSEDMNQNLLNENLIIIKLNDTLSCFSVSNIKKMVEMRPYYVVQGDGFFNIDENKNKTIRKNILSKQKMVINQILYFKNFAVDFSFVEGFQNSLNTFELFNPRNVIIGKDFEYNTIETILYSAKYIQRSTLFSDNRTYVVNEKFLEDNENYKNNDKDIDNKENILKESSLEKICDRRDPFDFSGDPMVYDRDLIVLFIAGNNEIVYCFTFKELKMMIQTSSIDSQKKRLIELPGEKAVLLKLEIWGIYVDVNKLSDVINEHHNTIELIKKPLKNNEFKISEYYEPKPASRKDVLPGMNLESTLQTQETIYNDTYFDENGYRYRKRIHYYFNENFEQTEKIYKIEWIRYKIGLNEQYQLHSYKDQPAITIYNNDEKHTKKTEEWYSNGILDRKNPDDLPAVIEYESGTIATAFWYQNGQISRDNDRPAIVALDRQGEKTELIWMKNGKPYRENDKPTKIFFKNGKISLKLWHNEEERNMKDLPSTISYYENGKIRAKKWTEDGLLNRASPLGDLPAEIEYYENGSIKNELWFQNDKYFRKPAIGLNGESINLPDAVSYYQSKNKDLRGNVEREEFHYECEMMYLYDLPAIINYYEDGKIEEKLWGDTFDDNDLNMNRRNGFPSEISYYKNGNIEREKWYQDNELFRENDLPSVIEYYENGNIKREVWYENGLKNRFYSEPGPLQNKNVFPAEIDYYENGKIKREIYLKNGFIGRDSYDNKTDLPSFVSYFENGNKEKELWFYQSKFGREFQKDLPSYIIYYNNDKPDSKKIRTKIWYKNGGKHRDEPHKPAEIWYFENGNIERKYWYQNGFPINDYNNGQPFEIRFDEGGNKIVNPEDDEDEDEDEEND